MPCRRALPIRPQGAGTYSVIKGTTPVVGHSASGKVWTYDIEVENGITGIDLAQFASLVDSTLADSRSWSGHGVALKRVDSGTPDFRVSLTSSLTVRTWCGYTIKIETSCYAVAGSVSGLYVNRVVINDSRWVRGDPAYVGDLNAYRMYMINHEDGHALGHMHAHECLSDGLAPAMMQQTIGLKTPDGQICAGQPLAVSAGGDQRAWYRGDRYPAEQRVLPAGRGVAPAMSSAGGRLRDTGGEWPCRPGGYGQDGQPPKASRTS